ncbi:DUF4262 domain-containing protein [Mycolicibacterium goodii]|uniref:DUF4262 domain-containing protein n=1 Tax=Mycolicibacterium goodii TaxID=134601 RepID=UPI0012FF8974
MLVPIRDRRIPSCAESATTRTVAIYGPQVCAWQLVWADDTGRWPWEPGWANGERKRPVLGARAQWPHSA